MLFSRKKESEPTTSQPTWKITEEALINNLTEKRFPIKALLFGVQESDDSVESTVWYNGEYLCNLRIPKSNQSIFSHYGINTSSDFIEEFSDIEFEDYQGNHVKLSTEEMMLDRQLFSLSGIRTAQMNQEYIVSYYGKEITRVDEQSASLIERAKNVFLSRKFGLQSHKNTIQKQKLYELQRKRLENVNQELVLLTTETNPDLHIIKRLDIITAECAFGMNVFKDIFASFTDTFGGRSKSIQNTLRDARKVVLDELRKEALSIGANAVIAVDLDYSEISGGGKSGMLFLVASGTAVITDKP